MDLEHSDINETHLEETYSVEAQGSEAIRSDVEEESIDQVQVERTETSVEAFIDGEENSVEIAIHEVKEYPIEHYYHKYIHIKDRVNKMICNMQYNRSRTVHLLLCVVEMVDKISEFNDNNKRELTLYIMNKLISKWNLYLRHDRKVLFELLSHIYDYLVKVTDGYIYTKESPSNFEYEEPNVITYTLFEKFDKEQNGDKFELMKTVLQLLHEVQKYSCLRVEESKYVVLKVTNMLLNNYIIKEDEQSLTLELLPDLIDTLMNIAKDKPKEIRQSRFTMIDETDIPLPKKKKPFFVCCS